LGENEKNLLKNFRKGKWVEIMEEQGFEWGEVRCCTLFDDHIVEKGNFEINKFV
jgi:hypothetical protein